LKARLLAVALALVAVWEIAVLLGVQSSVPTPASWRAAAKLVRSNAAEDALIVFAPSWIDPIGRHWLGDRIGLDTAARMDDVRYAEIWQISTRGAEAPEIKGLAASFEQVIGELSVRRYHRPAPQVSFDLRKQSQVRDVDFQPRKCVALELREDRRESRLVLDDVVLGERLHVYVGMANQLKRRRNRSSARLSVRIDDRTRTSTRITDELGWHSLLPLETQPGRHRLEFVASLDVWRTPVEMDVCVAAESRSGP